MNCVKTEVVEHFGVITLNREEKRNALGAELINDLVESLNYLKSQHIRALILRASSTSKTWSAGHDVVELPRNNADPLRWSDPLEEGIRAINRFPAPVIAMVHGTVWGGACDIILNCDLVVGDNTCGFAITPAKLGVPYNASGIMHFVMRLPLNVVKEMFFTALPLSAERALQVGILNHLKPENELEEYTYSLARHISTLSHQSIAVIKEQTRIIADSFAINPETWEYIQELRRKVYQGNHYYEGIEAFLEKRTPNFI